jgi:hypothetical protein
MIRFALTINGRDCIVDIPADMQLRSQPLRDLGQPVG